MYSIDRRYSGLESKGFNVKFNPSRKVYSLERYGRPVKVNGKEVEGKAHEVVLVAENIVYSEPVII